MIRLALLAGLVLAIGPGSLGSANAQSSVRVPQQIQRVPVQGLQRQPEQDTAEDEEEAPFISQRMMELAREAEQTRNRRNRPSHYRVECGEVSEVRVSSWELTVYCADEDPYGQRHYILWLNLDGFYGIDEAAEAPYRRWLAGALLDAIHRARADPGIDLILSISPIETRPGHAIRDLSGFHLNYSE
ncbi:hypothetical protein [Hyphobacterium sp.]|uniref:hypothetical protein n=1 Tax=Hyphobacterium sp. TaxID=2004662 RepID=UPI003B524401